MGQYTEALWSVGILVGLLFCIWLGIYLGRKTGYVKPQQPSPSDALAKMDLSFLKNPEITGSNARAIERMRQGGLSETQVHGIMKALEEAQELDAPEPKFTGRDKSARFPKRN